MELILIWWNSYCSLILVMKILYTLMRESPCEKLKESMATMSLLICNLFNKINVAWCNHLVDVTPSLGWTTYIGVSLLFVFKGFGVSLVWCMNAFFPCTTTVLMILHYNLINRFNVGNDNQIKYGCIIYLLFKHLVDEHLVF